MYFLTQKQGGEFWWIRNWEPPTRQKVEGPEGNPSGRRKISKGKWYNTVGVPFLEMVELGRKGETHGKRLYTWEISTKVSLPACATYQ